MKTREREREKSEVGGVSPLASDTPTRKLCFVLVFALRAVRAGGRADLMSRHVFVPASSSPSSPAAPFSASFRKVTIFARVV